MVYAALVDLGTLGVIVWLLGRDGGSYRGLLGPPTTAWQVALGAAGVLAASVPAVVFSGELTSALYGQDAVAPMFAVVDLPPWASVVSVLVVPLVGWCRFERRARSVRQAARLSRHSTAVTRVRVLRA